MKVSIIIILATLVSFIGNSQVAHDPSKWNAAISGTDQLSIFNPEDETMTATVTLEYNQKEYTKDVSVPAGDWINVNFIEDLGFSYENMPALNGAVEGEIRVDAGGQTIFGNYFFLSALNRNQIYDVDIKEIEDRINIYGRTIDNCLFWIDYSGYNYVIRSHNEDREGIFISHWVMNIKGDTERKNYYKSQEKCTEKSIQNHGIGFKLEDANEDGYMEFYSMIIDDCTSNMDEPLDAFLVVFTNITHLTLVGRTYGVGVGDDLGGDYTPTPGLIEEPKILESAEAAWEVYIME